MPTARTGHLKVSSGRSQSLRRSPPPPTACTYSPPHAFVLHLAAAAFMTVSGEKAYHSIRAGQRLYEQAASLPEMDVTLAVLVVCVDIAAAIFAFVVAKFSVRAPCTWSMAASAASLALLFAVGAGWYEGQFCSTSAGFFSLPGRSCR